MAFLSKIGKKFVVPDIFSWSPEASSCIDEWHEIVMRGESPLTVAERELITAYTSRLNGCALCSGVHSLVAEQFGIENGAIDAIIDDIDSAPVDDKIRPLLRFAKKLTQQPVKMTQADADAVFAAGWSEQALHDAINIICMANFMNRIVLAHGGTEGDISAHFNLAANYLVENGYLPPKSNKPAKHS
ncbi:MAG: peroxidase-related enzyme [Proteobacteria bacterium]|nr:peroxidase-related enzyme [Pseudomonadota bacterium]